MADGGELHTRRYSAFISYSHDDAPFARRLHRTLEGYRLPRRLSQAAPGRGGDARRLRPIFRDRDELSAASDLSQAVQAALAESSALIVICSPRAARSVWVGREVELFRRLHDGGAILAALIDGEPEEAFPPALCAAGPGGAILQPLAADFRRGGDGARLALLKLVAVLAGVRLDELVQRDAHRRVRQATLAGAAALAGMAAMGALALVAVRARNVAEQERNRGETLIDFMLTDLRGKLKGVGRLDLLDAVNQGAVKYFEGQDVTKMPASSLERRATLLQAMGADNEKRSKFAEARAQVEEARRSTAALLAAMPNDEQRILAYARTQFYVGLVAWRVGDDISAESSFRAYATLAQRLLSQSPGNANWRVEVGDTDSTLGTFLMRHYRDLRQAKTYYVHAIEHYQAASKLPVEDAEALEDITECLSDLGDIERLDGNLQSARNYRLQQLAILDRLQARDPRNADLRAQKAFNLLGMARIDMAEKHPEAALPKLEAGLDAATKLALDDPDNHDLSREVRIFELFWVRAWLDMPRGSHRPDGRIGTLLGCNNDDFLAKNEEISSFCHVLKARWTATVGGGRPDRGAAADYVNPQAPSGDRLTERWGIDLKAESQVPAK